MPSVQNQTLVTSIEERIQKLEKEMLNDADDFLFCLKQPLNDRIMSKAFIGKKSIKFTNFTGLQDPNMHVKKF